MVGELGEHLVTREVSEETLPYMFGISNHLLKQRNTCTVVVGPNSIVVSAKGDHFFKVLTEGNMESIHELRRLAKQN